MLEELKRSGNMNIAYTENGARAHRTTNSALLDFFSMAGAMRNQPEDEIVQKFASAFAETPTYAMKALFYIRDIRGGQGERRAFRHVLEYLGTYHTDVVINNIHLIAEFGRFDDLYSLVGTKAEDYALLFIKNQFFIDLESDNPSLLAKWLKSENASSKETKRLGKITRKALGMTSEDYRKNLSYLRKKINVVEQKMSGNEWDKIDYPKVPSKAGLQYSNAFKRHDPEGYDKYIDDVSAGKEKINTGTLYPYEIIGKTGYNLFSHSYMDEEVVNTMWENLPDYIGDNFTNALAVVDTSGSMSGQPMDVAISLGMYLAERNKGEFHNHFITFSGNPDLIELKGDTLTERARNMSKAHWHMNTDVEAVFNLILKTATDQDLPQEEMPEKIFIISDMEFDFCVRGSQDIALFQNIKQRYKARGYEMPDLIFWRANTLNADQVPVMQHESGTALVSGCSPTIFTKLLGGSLENPYDFMMEVLDDTRYAQVTV